MTKEPVNLASASIISASKHQLSVASPDETVILDPGSSVYYSLDGVGRRVWALIQEPRLVADVCETLLEEFEVSPDVMMRDLKVLLGELHAAGLIDIADEA